jgi:hypothetical protein
LWSEQPERVRAHWTRQMATHYRVQCTEDGWQIASAVRATFAD